MTGSGVRTVARLELQQRTRSSRWPIVLGVWFLVIAGVSVLTHQTVNDPDIGSGPAQYDIVMFIVLGLGMLIMPSLTATSVNGDREHGVLATLQTTLLTAGDIALGKLVASVGIATAFLVTALPFLVWAWAVGGISFGRILLSMLVLVLVLSVVCALGLMFSTLAARPVASAVLTYLATSTLVFGTLIVFGLSYFLVDTTEEVQVRGIPESFYIDQPREPTVADCVMYTRTQTVNHTERIWWLLAVNPFVVVADAAPTEVDTRQGYAGPTPMRYISIGVRSARAGDDGSVRDECYVDPNTAQGDPAQERPADIAGPVWPYGLSFLVLVGVGAMAVARARLRTPVRRLPNGTRIA